MLIKLDSGSLVLLRTKTLDVENMLMVTEIFNSEPIIVNPDQISFVRRINTVYHSLKYMKKMKTEIRGLVNFIFKFLF